MYKLDFSRIAGHDPVEFMRFCEPENVSPKPSFCSRYFPPKESSPPIAVQPITRKRDLNMQKNLLRQSV